MSIMSKAGSKFSYWNRQNKLNYIEKFISKKSIESCLIVGASPMSSGRPFQNFIEIGIVRLLGENVVVSGIEEHGNGWANWVCADGQELPFPNKSFDLVLSNAVVEHVGDRWNQKRFIDEHDRVGRNWILTTPNRLFPVESHPYLLFKHMREGYKVPGVTRLMSKPDLQEILPNNSVIIGSKWAPTFIVHNAN